MSDFEKIKKLDELAKLVAQSNKSIDWLIAQVNKEKQKEKPSQKQINLLRGRVLMEHRMLDNYSAQLQLVCGDNIG